MLSVMGRGNYHGKTVVGQVREGRTVTVLSLLSTRHVLVTLPKNHQV